ncbi:acyl dehydratase [Mycobacterium sp. EPa45]|nr:acyl dehydratase [Mycobacterium sp. EPa45]
MPIPTPTTQPFWDALAEHKVRIQYSPSAQRYVFYPRVLAPGTLADDLEWREISGAASLYTYTVAYRPVAPHFAADAPQLLAVVQWDEGPRFSTEIVNAEPADLRVGMCLAPVFCDYPDAGITMLRYEPA